MGYQGWVLVNGLRCGGRVELCLCAPTGGGTTNHACGTNIPTDGVGQIPPYFCAATETSCDISNEYTETKVNSLHPAVPPT